MGSEMCIRDSRLTVVFTATDACNNESTTSASFIVVDTLNPVFVSNPLDTVIFCDGTDGSIDLQSWLDNNGGATASDLCGSNISWTNDYTGTGIPSVSCDNDTTNRLTVTFTASDECANTIQATARFIVVDTLAPSIDINPIDTVFFCDGTDGLSELQSWLDNNGGATASELCLSLIHI